ncbi:MAG: hypothetical protein DRQ42_00195 [Gammaproteobacteria bacterium]|nr:MAG: hypothetical protein DRQ42_00195 [Gammaproteobacteria bacterium]
MPEIDESRLNPQIRKLEVGTRSLREIEVYPLSLADEIKLSKIIGDGLISFYESSKGDVSNETTVNFILEVIINNLGDVLEMVTEDVELSEVSNDQALDIAEIIYEVNFETVTIKVKGLFEKIQDLKSGRPSQSSVKSTQGTDSNTSTKRASLKEELQEGS